MSHFTGQSTRDRQLVKWAFRAILLCLPMVSLALLSGCNPAALAMMLMPFTDDREQPKCKLAAAHEEKTVAVVTWFGNRDVQLYPELVPADNELSEKMGALLRDRHKANNERVKIVPNAQVRVYQNKVASDTWSPAELGKKVKADYVIALEINALSLHQKGSGNTLFRGTTEIAVRVYDLSKAAGEQVMFDEIYQRAYPKESPMDAAGSVTQFRALFLNHVARDLSRWFAAYSHDERMYSMESD
jgi:hypothetical protein